MRINRPSKSQIGVVAVAGLSLIAATPLVIANMSNNGVGLAGSAVASKLMALLDARSPGSRSVGELSVDKSKAKKSLENAETRPRALGKMNPEEREFSEIISPAPQPSEEFTDVILPGVSGAQLSTLAALSDVVAPIAPGGSPGGGVLGPTPGGSVGPGPGGGLPVPPVLPEIVAPPEPVAPVPEPSTWLFMLLGFGAVGCSMRRARYRISTQRQKV